MDRGGWWAPVHGVSERVGRSLSAKQQAAQGTSLEPTRRRLECWDWREGRGWPHTQGPQLSGTLQGGSVWEKRDGERRWAQRGARAMALSGKPCSKPTECPSVPWSHEQAIHSHRHTHPPHVTQSQMCRHTPRHRQSQTHKPLPSPFKTPCASRTFIQY